MRPATITRMTLSGRGGEPVPVQGATQHDVAAADGQVYRLFVALPQAPPPPQGYPVLYLLDGNALFGTAVEAVRLQSGRRDVTGVDAAIVVAIGYPIAGPFDMERRQRDLLPEGGGADRFLGFIADRVMPFVATLATVDPARTALIGHSYGGLFVLHALFAQPGLFSAHVAGSPSIWWNDRAILASEHAFRAEPAPARLLIAVGGSEQDISATRDPARIERLTRARMLDNAREMAARLDDTEAVEVDFVVFEGENHISVLPAMLARAVAFALADRPTEEVSR